ncbi:hypothetical protein KHC33_01255 [Methanospirillum sp. J.3.6.1-F.2.7.3]|uniref:Uncharacterized protein n=1 Tax=Methanospirillum purgamenti TaxID=2834276 RepID=A0A8E7B2E6_9EURY|nr:MULTISPECIES: hypothetical protein [Methanospirillum]MDX8551796.1 hypothetical protein [Methanospirillum hungatei]QVV89192.1 hypothetical protein KHC33_01255 [Methanospirillum sp. J.3.6.1-F.2.7.3]
MQNQEGGITGPWMDYLFSTDYSTKNVKTIYRRGSASVIDIKEIVHQLIREF